MPVDQNFMKFIYRKERFIILAHLHWSVTSGLLAPISACAVRQPTAFAVSAALVPGQWQHRALTVYLHLAITEHEVGQAANIVYQVFSVTQLGFASSLPASVTRSRPFSWSKSFM